MTKTQLAQTYRDLANAIERNEWNDAHTAAANQALGFSNNYALQQLTAGPGVMSRAQFETLPATGQMNFMRNGGRVVDIDETAS